MILAPEDAPIAGPMLLATLGSAIPIALWLAFFYTRDRYEREPKRLIAFFFFLGAVPVAFVAGLVNLSLFTVGGVLSYSPAMTAGPAPRCTGTTPVEWETSSAGVPSGGAR